MRLWCGYLGSVVNWFWGDAHKTLVWLFRDVDGLLRELRIVNRLSLMLMILGLKRKDLRWWRCRRVVILIRNMSIVDWKIRLFVNLIGLDRKMSSIRSESKAISNIVYCVRSAIRADVTVITTNHFVWPVTSWILFDLNCIVRLIFIAEAPIRSTLIRRIDRLSVRIRAQIFRQLELVIPTIYILTRLSVVWRIITINSGTTRWLKQQCNEWWPNVLLRLNRERERN